MDNIFKYRLFKNINPYMLKHIVVEAKKEIALGRYRHFKGNEYEVLAIARHSETQEPMVVYKALYGEQAVWVRPASMWTEEVPEPNDPNDPNEPKSEKSDSKSGKRVKRFLRV